MVEPEKIELKSAYTASLSPRDLDNTQQNANILFSYDVWGDLDFVLGIVWTRVGMPQADEDGIAPEPDDLRIDVGLSWSFWPLASAAEIRTARLSPARRSNFRR